jgi:hypothetical protein
VTAALQQTLLTPASNEQVIADCLTLIDQELSEKSGVSGNAVRLAYKTANALAPGYLRDMVGKVLPLMAQQLEPYWSDFQASGGAEFGDYLAKRGDEVAASLLSVTDSMAERSDRPAIVRAYNTVRGSAARHVEAALPRVGALAQKYGG